MTDKSDKQTDQYGAITSLDQLPPRIVGGQPNPDYYRAQLALHNRASNEAVLGGRELPRGYNYTQAINGILKEAELAGIDPKHLIDARTEAEKALDAARTLTQAPSSLLEIADDELDALERAMDTAQEKVRAYGQSRIDAHSDPPEDIEAQLKGWRRRIERVRRLRDRARHPLPTWADRKGKKINSRIAWVYRASHALRFMIYVNRSSMKTDGHASKQSRAQSVYLVGDHHAKLAFDVWEAENGVRVSEKGMEMGRIQYDGVIGVMPPGHGKSAFSCANSTLRLSLNPDEQAIYLHASSGIAEDHVRFIANAFMLDNESGRRRNALFPGLTLDESNAGGFRIKRQQRAKSNTMSAYGSASKKLGADTNFQVWDDVVPQSDGEQETERKRRYQTLVGTWQTRQRGQAFLYVYGTLWHHDDALARLIEQARLAAKTNGRQGVPYRVSIQKCGGPNEKFRPLWREAYPPRFLKQKHAASPRLYAANYMANPLPEESRLVKKVRLYDVDSREHAEFLAGSVKHISCDPSATNTEKADKAGVLYLGKGEVIDRVQTQWGMEVRSEHRVRVLDAFEVSATQSELVDVIGGYCQRSDRPVDYVHFEGRSGFRAFGEMFANKYGVDLIRHDPTNKKKEIRLRHAAPMIEDSNATMGIRAVVEFPARRERADDPSSLKLLPQFQEIVDQILDFGVHTGDHMLDSLTQFCLYFQHELSPGKGAVSEQIRKTPDQRGTNQRMRQIVSDILHPKQPGPGEAYDQDFDAAFGWQEASRWN